MKNIIRKILKEEFLLESEGGAFSEDLAVELWKNVLSYPQSRTKKTYDYLDWVAGETAFGALHWTGSGFPQLYRIMGDDVTQKYFGKSVEELINFTNEVKTKELNYPWWENGMRNFMKSPENITVQNEAIHNKFTKMFRRYGVLDKGWSTPRQYAIGMSLINSAPKCFKDAGKKYNWNAEEMMRYYCKGSGGKSNLNNEEAGCSYTRGCRGRCVTINKFYPAHPTSGYVWDVEQYNKYCKR